MKRWVFRSGLQLATYRTDDSVLNLSLFLNYKNAKFIFNVAKVYNSLTHYILATNAMYLASYASRS